MLVVSDTVWHTRWMAQASRQINIPREGGYAIKIVKGGLPVPVWVSKVDGWWIAASPVDRFKCVYVADEIDAQFMDALMDGEVGKHPFLNLLMHGRQISEAEYNHLMDLRAWAVDNAPWHPCLHPEKPVDFSKMPPLGRKMR